MKTATIEELAYVIKQAEKNQSPKPIVFLGAGASKTAGIPLAAEIATDILQQYKSNPKVASLSKNKRTYDKLMECLLPDERNSLLKNYIDKAKINVTHIYLAQLIIAGYVDYVLTVNFDNLMLRALALYNVFPPVYDMAILKDLTTTAFKEKSVVYLHGQHHGLWLLNTAEETKRVETTIPPIIHTIKNRRPWIFIGYSGEDPIFKHIIKLGCFDNGLYWIGYNNNKPLDHVCSDLLDKPNTNAHLIEGYDADAFMQRLSIELGIPQPAILVKPFTALKEMLGNIVDIDDNEQYKTVKERLQLAQENVKTAIEQFEEGKIANNKELQEEVSLSLLKQEIIDLQLSKIYNNNKLRIVEEKVIASKNDELKVLLSDVYVGFSYNYNNQKQFDKAIDCGNKAISLNKNNGTAYNNRGFAYHGLKQYKKAIADYDMAISIFPSYYSAFNNRGYTYIALKEYDKSIADFDKAIELDSKYPNPYKHRGVAHMNKGLYDLALSDLDFAINLKPVYLSAYEARAELYEKMGEKEKAEQDRAKAKQLKEKAGES